MEALRTSPEIYHNFDAVPCFLRWMTLLNVDVPGCLLHSVTAQVPMSHDFRLMDPLGYAASSLVRFQLLVRLQLSKVTCTDQ